MLLLIGVCIFVLLSEGWANVCGPILSVDKVPSNFNIRRDFYKKYLIGPGGVPIISSEKVKDEALYRAQNVMYSLAKTMNNDIFTNIAKVNIRMVIMAETEMTTDIPEHSDLVPKDYWDARARGLGSTLERPATSGGEENLICTPGDRYKGECIFLHELAHSIHMFGMDSTFNDRILNAYSNAKNKGLFNNTYAMENYLEYWAEGSQSYFNCNAMSNPSNGIHNEIGTRRQIKMYDPELFGLLEEVYMGANYVYSCDTTPICNTNTITTTTESKTTSITSATFTEVTIQTTTESTKPTSTHGSTDVSSALEYKQHYISYYMLVIFYLFLLE